MTGPDTRAPDVAVVGGGLAGIAAALAAADAGAKVVLFERRPGLGGAAASLSRRGQWYDRGQHVFLRCCTAYRTLVDRIGGGRHLYLQPRLEIPVVRPGRPPAWISRTSWPAPLHLGPAIARYAHLAPVERALVGRAALGLRRLDTGDRRLDETTFAAWLREHGQSQTAIDRLWDLIALPTLNVRAEEASLLAAARTFQTGLLHDPSAADMGWATVPLSQLHHEQARDALAAAGVEVRLRSTVRRVESHDGVVRLALGDGVGFEAGTAIVAVPHHQVVDLLPSAPDGYLWDLGRLATSPIVDVHLRYGRSATPYAVIACLETTAQWVFDRSELVGLEPGRYVVVSLSAADTAIHLPSSALIRRIVRDLGRLFPELGDTPPLEAFVTREPRATFRATPGSDALRVECVSPLPGVFLAGAWTDTGWPATMEGAVRSGWAAAAASTTA